MLKITRKSREPGAVSRERRSKLKAHGAKLIALAQRGNGEADFAFVLTTPLLAGIMLTGLFFALIGFYRVGASWSNQLGTQAGAVGEDATSLTTNLFGGWAGNAPTKFASFGINADQRIVTGNAAAKKSMGAFFVYGDWGNFDLKATNTTRYEKFYPGKKSCAGGECSE